MTTVADAIADAHHGRKQMVKCPTHADGQASLHVGPGTRPNEDGVIQPVVLHCHAGCETKDILAAEGIDWTDIAIPKDTTSIDREEWTPHGSASHVYDYVDEEGTLLFQALRVPQPGGKKAFAQRQPDTTKPSGWAWNLQGVRRVIYRLPEVIEGVANGRRVFVVEGEKDAEALRMGGHLATCCPMGAGKWRPEFSEFFRGADVTIIADADEPGREHARQVKEEMLRVEANSVEIRESTIAKDYFDHAAKGGSVETMSVTFTTAPLEREDHGLGIIDMIDTEWDLGTEIIPGYLARSNVVLITGFEGHGKSTVMRQLAVCCAGGLHPFRYVPMPKLKVLFIDAENPEHQQVLDWRKMVGLLRRHGHDISNEDLVILSEWAHEPDLTSTSGQAWLVERVQAHRPDIVFMGPVQNLVSRDVKDDEVVRKLKHAVNTARSICGTAFIIEHHAPHKGNGDSERSTRPYGSSLFQKWPDFGYGLKPDKEIEGRYTLHPNRKPRVRRRAWPEVARWGAVNSLEWPWMFETEDVRFSKNDDEATRAHLRPA